MVKYILNIAHPKQNKFVYNLLQNLKIYYQNNNIKIKSISNLPDNVFYINQTGYLNGMFLKEGNYVLNILLEKDNKYENIFSHIKVYNQDINKTYLYKITNARNLGFIKYRDNN